MSSTNNYRINEGTLSVPDEFIDRTINVFANHPTQPSLAFNISRDKLLEDETLDDYLKRQLSLLKKGLKQFRLLEQNQLACGDGQVIEIITTYKDRNNQIVFQSQAVLPVNEQGALLVFTVTSVTKMNDTQKTQWRQLITSYQSD